MMTISRRGLLGAAASFSVLISTTAAWAQNGGGQAVKDAWETELPANYDWKSCTSLDSFLVRPVFDERRPAAVALLETTEIVRLSDAQAAAFIGAENSSAPKFVARLIARLEAQKASALGKSQGSWSVGAEMELRKLRHSQESASLLSPFLVRWVTPASNGTFQIGLCGDDLALLYVFSGAPPTTRPERTPVVAFLERMPRNVLVLSGKAKQGAR